MEGVFPQNDDCETDEGEHQGQVTGVNKRGGASEVSDRFESNWTNLQ